MREASRFPEFIAALPEASFREEARVAIHQGARSQVLFIEAVRDFAVPPHVHAAEWGVILEGEIEMTIDGKTELHRAGEEHVIPAGVEHAFAWRKGTRAVLFFDEPQRVKPR